jgi:hypothetical protein
MTPAAVSPHASGHPTKYSGLLCVPCRAVGTVSAKLHFCDGPKLSYSYSCTVEPCASLKVKNALEQSVYCLAVCAICNLIIDALIPAMSVCLLIPAVGLWVVPV